MRCHVATTSLLCVLLSGCGLALDAGDLPSPPTATEDSTDSTELLDSTTQTGASTDSEPSVTDPAWIALDSGTFDMGSTSGDPDEQPVRVVTVGSFELMRGEITVAQYNFCVSQSGCQPPTDTDCAAVPAPTDDTPLNCLTWQESADFCAFVGGALPSEAQWEYAATSQGTRRPYPWGDAEPTCEHAVMAGCGANGPLPECSKPLGNTAQGLCDMAGNLREWVLDWFQSSYAGCPVDGRACSGPQQVARGMRSGAYDTPASYLRAADRAAAYPTSGQKYLGARCARPN